MGYDFDIQYRKGTTNVTADALSWKDEAKIELHSLSSTNLFSLEDLFKEIE